MFFFFHNLPWNLSRDVFDLSDHSVSIKALIMLVDIGWRWRGHFIFLIRVRKSRVVMCVVMVVINGSKVAVFCRVSLTQHVRCHEIGGLSVDGVWRLRRWCLNVRWCKTAVQAQIIFCEEKKRRKSFFEGISLVRKSVYN